MAADHPEANDECGGCDLHGRRRFLLSAASFLAAGHVLLPTAVRAMASAPGRILAGSRSDGARVRYSIPQTDGISIDVDNEVILVRTAGTVIAFALACPHQRAMLRQKRGDTAFQCPKHKSEYKPDGVFIRGRATRNMDRRALRREGSEVIVDVDSLIRSDEDAAGWQAATIVI